MVSEYAGSNNKSQKPTKCHTWDKKVKLGSLEITVRQSLMPSMFMRECLVIVGLTPVGERRKQQVLGERKLSSTAGPISFR